MIAFEENMVSVFDIRNYLQRLTDAEQALLNEVVVQQIVVRSAKNACYE